MSNRAAVLHGVHDLRIEDVPTPTPGPHEVLVAISAVGICGSDVHYYEHGRIGDFVVEAPMVLGHESGGVVVELGSEVNRTTSGLSIGQRVALEPGVPCRRCAQCRAGRYNLCPDVRFFATPPID
ncbi:MAG: alcohol dehydrogenase catalytic domain-containing protein, partial [bacterium]